MFRSTASVRVFPDHFFRAPDGNRPFPSEGQADAAWKDFPHEEDFRGGKDGRLYRDEGQEPGQAAVHRGGVPEPWEQDEARDGEQDGPHAWAEDNPHRLRNRPEEYNRSKGKDNL